MTLKIYITETGRLSPLSHLGSLPSLLLHDRVGVGLPPARQVTVTLLPTATVFVWRDNVTSGGPIAAAAATTQQPIRSEFYHITPQISTGKSTLAQYFDFCKELLPVLLSYKELHSLPWTIIVICA